MRNILITVAILLLTVGTARAECLTLGENQTLQNLATNTSLSFDDLYAIFDSICARISQVNETATAIPIFNSSWYYITNDTYNKNETFNKNETYSQNDTYNRTEIDSTFSTLNASIEQTEARINWNYTQILAFGNETMQSWIDQNNRSLDQKKVELEDMFDDKVAEFRRTFATKDDITNATIPLWTAVEYRPTTMDIWAPYLFGIVAAAVIGLLLLYKFKPGITKAPIFKDLRAERHTVDELTTETETKRKVDYLRELKNKIAQEPRLDPFEKAKLIIKVDDGGIINEADIENEISILESTKPKRRIERGHPRGRRRADK